MTQQYNIEFSRELTNKGIQKAVDHADMVHQNWSDKAYAYLLAFVMSRKPGERFMMEDIRQDASTVVPDPPSYKAWGSIARRAIYEGVIRKVGYGQVKNIKAHKANASIYIRNI